MSAQFSLPLGEVREEPAPAGCREPRRTGRPNGACDPSPAPLGRTLQSARRRQRRLWLALDLPLLPLEAPHAQGIVASGRDARAVVVAASAAAHTVGIRAGMRVSAALVLDPGVQVLMRDLVCETEALRWIGACSGRFTGFVSLRAPSTVLLEIGASLRLFGGLPALVDGVSAMADALGYSARIGVAPTAEAACLLARAGEPAPVLTAEELRGRLARLPLTFLGLPGRVAEALHETGLASIEACLRLPRADFARRFGPAVVEQIDRALGLREEVLERYEPPRRFERRVQLAHEVHEVAFLIEAARRPLNELCGHLAARGEGVRRLAVHAIHRRGPASRVVLELMRPSRDPHHLLDLVSERLERLTLDRSVEALGVRLVDAVTLAATAGDLFGAVSRTDDAWETLLEWLRSRAGREAVREIRPHPDHRPERAWRWYEAGRATATVGEARHPPRPLWLLEQPRLLVQVDGQPWLDGPLEIRDGPERIESGWWDGDDVARDYFVALGTAGDRLWIYRDLRSAGEWYLHGRFG